MSKNQPIHDQLLLLCLVKQKYSRGTVDKKELKAILEKVCWPRRYIFPHKPGLRRERAAPGFYTGGHITRRFPGIYHQSGNRDARRVCSRVTQCTETWCLCSLVVLMKRGPDARLRGSHKNRQSNNKHINGPETENIRL